MRHQCGLAIYAIELEPDTVEMLIARGLVAREDVADRHALAFALGVALEDLLAVTP